jgi:Putative MetA-pathway of phenol degradation
VTAISDPTKRTLLLNVIKLGYATYYPARRYRCLLRLSLLLIILMGTMTQSAAQGCPTSAEDIDTDRPDVTNSPLAVPPGSFQVESGVTWTTENGSDMLDATNTLLRLGLANCTELAISAPTYLFAVNGPALSGFNDVVLSFKRQLPSVYGFKLAAFAGLEFPSGNHDLSKGGYDPYLQGSWSRDLPGGWGVAGMFTIFWFTSQSSENPTFEPTFEVTRNLLPSVDSFVEYVGDYPEHSRPAQVLDAGATWLIARRQQLDVHFGFGLNSSSPDHFFGIGYSFRLDRLF